MLQKKVFKINGMHCTSCALNIDLDLEEIKGVRKSSTSYAKHETIVEFDNNIIKPERIIELIKKTGYIADLT
jgi:copper chaperone CopZ